ncbi:MAG: class I SAM-dependent methyltransferase [Treponema sp.]|jgi:2-polyprenyl-3-methyl-5-hydroxy-6-metoxy-1,4-benzoquinol methylase|nr:class I SAM-dependent methyltransferase [Treponema sp.]
MKTWSTPVKQQNCEQVPCALCGGAEFKPYLSCEGFSYVICKKCKLVQMNPQPKTEDVQFRYREDHGKDYLSYELANEETFLRLQELSLKDAGFHEAGFHEAGFHESENLDSPWDNKKSGKPSVLDIGCATGALLARLRERGWKTTGVEISLPQAEYARRERGLDVRTAPLEENHFDENSFTAVLASHLIEHLNNPSSLVREAHRILVPGGGLFITTPNIAGFQFRLFRGRWRSAIFDHLYLFSAKTLKALLAQNGFVIEKTVTWGGLAAGTVPAPLKRAADKAAKRVGAGDVMMIRSVKSS